MEYILRLYLPDTVSDNWKYGMKLADMYVCDKCPMVTVNLCEFRVVWCPAVQSAVFRLAKSR